MTLTPVERAGVKNQVFVQLRDRIMERTWLPGSKIPSENALAEALGVSRVSIREALHMLASLGLLETRHGGGTHVREYTADIFLNPLLPMLALDEVDILHVMEYRKLVERGIVSLVVNRAGEEEIDALEQSYRDMVANTNDVRAFAEADLRFHLLLAKATRNPIIIKVSAVIMEVLKVSMYGIVGSLGTKDGLYFHRKILDAIKARDGRQAEALMEEHVGRTIRRLKRKQRSIAEPDGDSTLEVVPPEVSRVQRGSRDSRAAKLRDNQGVTHSRPASARKKTSRAPR